MAGPESLFYQKLKKQMHAYFIQRVENSVDVGTPDLFFCSAGKDNTGWPQGWIELKSMTMPKRKGSRIKPDYRPGQYSWLKRAYNAGVLVILLIETDIGIYSFVGKDIRKDYNFEEFNEKGTFFDHKWINVNDEKGRQTFYSYLNGL